MSEVHLIPCLPETAPFNAEQRAYLNGFIAGLLSRRPASEAPPVASERRTRTPLVPLCVLFGSQTGNAEKLAKRIAREAGQRGFAATIHDMATYPVARLAAELRLLLVTSTYGDGDPPDGARAFWDALNSASAPTLTQTSFSVCALGDSNYPKFCAFGRAVESRFLELGGRAVFARADCDVDFEVPFACWLDGALAQIGKCDNPGPAADLGNGVGQDGVRSENSHLDSAQARGAETADRGNSHAIAVELTTSLQANGAAQPAGFSRSNPFSAALLANRRLNGQGSEKDTRHFEIDLSGSGIQYEPGDALGILPSNCPELVEELLTALRFAGAEAVPAGEGTMPVREAFLRHYEITRIPQGLLRVMAERTGDERLVRLVSPEANGELSSFLRGREIIDLLLAHTHVRFTPIEFVRLLRKLNPRLYSISSSPKVCPGAVHVTVNVVRYETHSRGRKGVCSTFLAERVPVQSAVPVFLHANRGFRLPANADTPMIMVGPGTGVAPFRGFLQERVAIGARGRHWLFFGAQRVETDFLYRDELESFARAGVLRLDTAFSRDQTQKLYVQDRMREHAKELFAWLEEGAHFYVCGDALRMAKDVDATLHEVVRTAGGFTAQRAGEYVARLKAEKRYQRDIY